jgi:uncharacterized integral membrane protein
VAEAEEGVRPAGQSSSAEAQQSAAGSTAPPSAGPDPSGSGAAPAGAVASARTERTRTATAFSGVVAGAVVFLALLIFILENTEGVKVNFFGATGHIALGVALLLASVAGALIVAALGAARIGQLRRKARRQSLR